MDVSSVKEWPDTPGVYVVWGEDSGSRPTYVGMANSLRRRWSRDHLSGQSNRSALRRTLGTHLSLTSQKLRKPKPAYPRDVEKEITKFLNGCQIDLHVTVSAEEAAELERVLIASLNPLLNVQRSKTQKGDN
jgi:excinuclease UvrABC nuclease subunit